MNDHAVDGFQQRQFDEILPLDEAAGRRRRGDDQQRIAGVGIDAADAVAPGLASGTVTLASAGSAMFRVTVNGSGDVWPRSAKVSVQLGAVGAAFAFERRASAAG